MSLICLHRAVSQERVGVREMARMGESCSLGEILELCSLSLSLTCLHRAVSGGGNPCGIACPASKPSIVPTTRGEVSAESSTPPRDPEAEEAAARLRVAVPDATVSGDVTVAMSKSRIGFTSRSCTD